MGYGPLNAGMPSGNDYTHPTYPAKSSGLYKVTVDETGHISEATPAKKEDITALGIPAQDTTYSETTESTPGLMSPTEKKKLSGIEEGATKTVVDSALSSTSTNPVQNKAVNTALGGKAPTSHASSATTYGIGTSSNYGHVKLSDSTSSTSAASSGIAASPKAVKAAYDLANTANTGLSGKAESAHKHSASDITDAIPITGGGTGKNTAPLGLYALVNGSSALTSAGLADGDYIPIGDVSATTGKKVTLANLVLYIRNEIGIGATQGISYFINNTTVGAIVLFNYKYWRVVHVDGSTVYLALEQIEQATAFGSNTTYSGSTIAELCNTYMNNMAPDSLALCQSITTSNVTSKVFIPTKTQVASTFAWYQYEVNRMVYQNGTGQAWWLSTSYNTNYAYYINTNGIISYASGSPGNSYGFRPHVAIKLP